MGCCAVFYRPVVVGEPITGVGWGWAALRGHRVGEELAFGEGPCGVGGGAVQEDQAPELRLCGETLVLGLVQQLLAGLGSWPAWRGSRDGPWLRLLQEQTQEKRGAQIAGQTVRTPVVTEGRLPGGGESLEGLESQGCGQ